MYPISADSICQFAPNVATNPKPIACGPGVFDFPATDCAPRVVATAPSATSSDATDRCTFSPHSCSPPRVPRNALRRGGIDVAQVPTPHTPYQPVCRLMLQKK